MQPFLGFTPRDKVLTALPFDSTPQDNVLTAYPFDFTPRGEVLTASFFDQKPSDMSWQQKPGLSWGRVWAQLGPLVWAKDRPSMPS